MKLFKVKGPLQTYIIEAATAKQAMREYVALVCPLATSKATPQEVAGYLEDGNQIVRTSKGGEQIDTSGEHVDEAITSKSNP
jgi:hypothetical protein